MTEKTFEFRGAADDGGRIDAPAFHRNHAPIWSVLSRFLVGRAGDVLEIGSGTGQHVVAFARETPTLTWWPSDPLERHRRSIAAWRAQAGLANVREPVALDLAAPAWGLAEGTVPQSFLAIFCANVIHVAPWTVAEGLMGGAAARLAAGGRLFLYGPFKRGGAHTAPTNADFDLNLRSRNPEWGVRDIDDIATLATQGGLRLAEIIDMPANNLILVFERS